MESGDAEICVHSSNYHSNLDPLNQGHSVEVKVSPPRSDSHSDTHDFDSNKAVEGEEHNGDDSFEDEEFETESEMVLSTTANNSFDEAETCETPADVAFVKTKKEQNKIAEIIESTKQLGTSSIELSRKHLQSFPEMLLDLSYLEVIIKN